MNMNKTKNFSDLRTEREQFVAAAATFLEYDYFTHDGMVFHDLLLSAHDQKVALKENGIPYARMDSLIKLDRKNCFWFLTDAIKGEFLIIKKENVLHATRAKLNQHLWMVPTDLIVEYIIETDISAEIAAICEYYQSCYNISGNYFMPEARVKPDKFNRFLKSCLRDIPKMLDVHLSKASSRVILSVGDQDFEEVITLGDLTFHVFDAGY